MSLINKMLQDLDARGTPAGDAFTPQIKPVEREPYRPNLRAIAAAVGGSLAGLALAWFGWTQYQQRQAPAPAPARLAVAGAAPVASTNPASAVTAALPAAQLAASPVASAPAPAPAVPAPDGAAKSVQPFEPDSPEARAARQALARELDARADALKARLAALAGERHASAAAPEPVRHDDTREERAARRAKPEPAQRAARTAHAGADAAAARHAPKARADGAAAASHASAAAAPAAGHASAAGVRATGPNPRAEAEYRRALASLQDGRMAETIAALENALRIEPAHEAARQTLVGLLVEAGRGDDAVRQLQLGLSLDPRQPAMAMLLARLQIERGGNGIDTLTRTLPYAGNNADYRAFLAGALQRQQRHREAAEQYQAALRGEPGNAVWWMGLGMSLQADKRDGEALEAFRKARAAGLPSQELQAFVERRIQQLGR